MRGESPTTSIRWNEPLPLNPWIHMWTRPRVTIQGVVDTDPRRHNLLLAALLGVVSGIEFFLPAAHSVIGWPAGLLIGVPLVALAGIYALYVSAGLLSWIGRRMGGVANSANLRAALAWSGVPMLWGLLLWIPRSIWLDSRLVFEPLGAPSAYSSTVLGFLLFDLTINVWTFVLLMKAVGQVQGFSARKTLANLVVVGLIVIAPFLLVMAAGVLWALYA